MIVDAHVWRTDEVRESAGSKTNAKRRKRGMGGRRPGKSGREWMRLAADRLIWRRAKKLAEMLSDKAVDGDLPSVKLLVALAEGGNEQAKPKKRLHRLTAAQELTEDLRLHGEWNGEPWAGEWGPRDSGTRD